MPFVLAGEEVAARHCALLAGLAPYYAGSQGPAIARPAPTGRADRTSEAVLTLDPAFAHFYVVLIDAGGVVRPLLDLTDPAVRDRRIAQGVLADDGGGRYRLTLPPYSASASAPSQMLVAVLASDALPEKAFAKASGTGQKAWIAALADAAGALKFRVEAAEYVQAP